MSLMITSTVAAALLLVSSLTAPTGTSGTELNAAPLIPGVEAEMPQTQSIPEELLGGWRHAAESETLLIRPNGQIEQRKSTERGERMSTGLLHVPERGVLSIRMREDGELKVRTYRYEIVEDRLTLTLVADPTARREYIKVPGYNFK